MVVSVHPYVCTKLGEITAITIFKYIMDDDICRILVIVQLLLVSSSYHHVIYRFLYPILILDTVYSGVASG